MVRLHGVGDTLKYLASGLSLFLFKSKMKKTHICSGSTFQYNLGTPPVNAG
jgi:hypothetical protein